jgi:hypothetical protein
MEAARQREWTKHDVFCRAAAGAPNAAAALGWGGLILFAESVLPDGDAAYRCAVGSRFQVPSSGSAFAITVRLKADTTEMQDRSSALPRCVSGREPQLRKQWTRRDADLTRSYRITVSYPVRRT